VVLLLACAVALPLSSCALIGKAPKKKTDLVISKYRDGEDSHWNELYSITGTATATRTDGRLGYFIQSNGGTRGEDTSFSWPDSYTEILLDPHKRYHFTIRTHYRRMRDSYGVREYKSNYVEKIVSLDGATIFDASQCAIHDQMMRWDWEETGSMEDYANSPFFSIQARKFPHDGYAYLACGSGYYRQKRWACAKCSKERDLAVNRLGIRRY
jgi:hypothetical protein